MSLDTSSFGEEMRARRAASAASAGARTVRSYIKPDPRVFKHACTTLGAEPSQCATVGDRYDRDVVGALDAEMYTVFMNVHGITLSATDRAPHVTVADLAGVPAALGIHGPSS